MRAELNWSENAFGYGYYDGPGGALSHFIWGSAQGEHGPYTISIRAYQNTDQLLELLALIQLWGDQVNAIGMLEFREVQLQDFIRQPIRQRRVTQGSKFETKSGSLAYWQARILDLDACLAKTHLPGPEVRFNLDLSDPVASSLDAGSNWQGIAGRYVVTLGPDSGAEPGEAKDLPTLTASVNAFTRMWLGALSASSLTISADLKGPDDLIRALDRTVRLPAPQLAWDF